MFPGKRSIISIHFTRCTSALRNFSETQSEQAIPFWRMYLPSIFLSLLLSCPIEFNILNIEIRYLPIWSNVNFRVYISLKRMLSGFGVTFRLIISRGLFPMISKRQGYPNAREKIVDYKDFELYFPW